MKNILVIFGGVSSEHEVSRLSAFSVISNMPRERYDVTMLGITKDGRWRLFTGDPELIPDGRWESDAANLSKAVVSPDRSAHGLWVDGGREIYVDVVFPVLHGKNGEDGTIQGLFQLAGIPFVGCDMLSSAVSMDKMVTNTLADYSGIPQAKWLGTTAADYSADPKDFRRKCAEKLGFPMFVKPANAGSSVGITKVKSADALADAIDTAFEHDRRLVVEEGIDAVELECSVLGNDSPIAPVVGEVKPCNEFYDYEAKYLAGDSELYIPARVSPEIYDKVREGAVKVFRTMGCSGMARVDFFLERGTSRVLFNELNTIPGFTSISMYSKILSAAGIPYGELIEKLILLALERAE